MKSVITFFLCMGCSLSVFAQQSNVNISVPKTKAPQKVFYNFDEVDITGQLKKPVGGSVLQTPEIRFQKLLNLDESFIPKIIDAVDEY